MADASLSTPGGARKINEDGKITAAYPERLIIPSPLDILIQPYCSMAAVAMPQSLGLSSPRLGRPLTKCDHSFSLA